MVKKILAGAVAALAVLMPLALAIGQEAAPIAESPVIDFKPILAELALALVSVLGAALLYMAKLARDWFKARTGVELQISDEQMRQVLDKAIQYGMALAVGRLGDRAHISVSNAQVAQIANYVIAAVPGALANFGITPERLQDMIRARLIAWTDGQPDVERASPSGPAVEAAS